MDGMEWKVELWNRYSTVDHDNHDHDEIGAVRWIWVKWKEVMGLGI